MVRRLALTTAAALTAAIAAWVATAWWAPLPARLVSPGSTVVLFADGRTAHVTLAPDDRWRIPTDDLDPRYLDALLRYEDKRFWYHPGTDPIAVARALAVNLAAGRVRTGASTLTLQLVRVLEPRPRSLWSKLVESHRALTLELHLDKQQILEHYTSFAPFGGNLEGVEAASLAFFGHSADALSADEIATLLAIPQSPAARHPSPANRARLTEARQRIARFLVDEGLFKPNELDNVARSAVPADRRPFPRHAPHLAATLGARHGPGARIPTHLDRGIQRMLEDKLAAERDRLAGRGVHNGVAIVVHTATRQIRGAVGNLGYVDGGDARFLSALDIPRSPGSTLKPFLYAAAIDRGLALPETLVEDVPASWPGYTPSNYDDRFRGLVPLEHALSQSLNLPFVALLAELGVEPTLHTLRRLGAGSLRDRTGHYGLSLAVGGAELTPLELAEMYAALADRGRWGPLQLTPAPEAPRVPVFSEGAAHLTARALRLRDRPDFPSRRLVSSTPPQIAWKTGTSFGHRDAWAIGFGDAYTAVVWLGNLNYEPARALVGGELAGPLLFDVLEASEGRSAHEHPPPDDLIEVQLCALSGRLPGVACPRHQTALALATSVPTATCDLHHRLAIDRVTGEALTAACRSGRTWDERDLLIWPANVRRHLADRLRDLPTAPPWAPGCRPDATNPPVILSPHPGQTAILIPGVSPEEQEIPLSATSGLPGHLAWFVNGHFLGRHPADERVWWTPVVGEHRVVVEDDAGNQATRTFRVRHP